MKKLEWHTEQRKVSELIPHEENPRQLSEDQRDQLIKSFEKFNFVEIPVINLDGVLLAGHQRTTIMKLLNREDEVIDVRVPNRLLNEKEAKEYLIRSNKNTGAFDFDMLANHFEVADLTDWGFQEWELGNGWDIEDEPVEVGEDEFDSKPPEEPKTELGRIYQLGDHRLMCGDSTSEDDVRKLMDGELADMVFTDPPYNTGMKAIENPGEKAWLSHMFNDCYTDEEWENFMRDFCSRYNEALKEDSFLFICLDWRRSHELVPHLKKHWKFSNLIIWDKMVHGLGSDYKYTHEFIHVCKKGKPPIAKNKNGDREYQDVWRIQRVMGRDEEHATKKPMELCTRGISHGSNKNDIILDLFGGSGSTLIACEQTSRKCRMMELDPKYCDVIVKRYCKLTEQDAEKVFETGVAS